MYGLTLTSQSPYDRNLSCFQSFAITGSASITYKYHFALVQVYW